MDSFGSTAQQKFSFWLAELSFDSKVPYNGSAPGIHREQSFSYPCFFIFQSFRYADYYHISQNLPACRDACEFGFGKRIFEVFFGGAGLSRKFWIFLFNNRKTFNTFACSLCDRDLKKNSFFGLEFSDLSCSIQNFFLNCFFPELFPFFRGNPDYSVH